jgi:hypothetical protein
VGKCFAVLAAAALALIYTLRLKPRTLSRTSFSLFTGSLHLVLFPYLTPLLVEAIYMDDWEIPQGIYIHVYIFKSPGRV